MNWPPCHHSYYPLPCALRLRSEQRRPLALARAQGSLSSLSLCDCVCKLYSVSWRAPLDFVGCPLTRWPKRHMIDIKTSHDHEKVTRACRAWRGHTDAPPSTDLRRGGQRQAPRGCNLGATASRDIPRTGDHTHNRWHTHTAHDRRSRLAARGSIDTASGVSW